MSHPYPPQHIAGSRKRKPPAGSSPYHHCPDPGEKKGIVLDAGVGNENGSEQQHPFPVNIHRILPYSRAPSVRIFMNSSPSV